MEFDVTMRVKVDPALFIYSQDPSAREFDVLELIRAAMYTCDDIEVLETEVMEVPNG